MISEIRCNIYYDRNDKSFERKTLVIHSEKKIKPESIIREYVDSNIIAPSERRPYGVDSLFIYNIKVNKSTSSFEIEDQLSA